MKSHAFKKIQDAGQKKNVVTRKPKLIDRKRKSLKKIRKNEVVPTPGIEPGPRR